MTAEPSTLERDLADIRRRLASAKRTDQVIAEMWAHATDLRRQGIRLAQAKTEAERRLSRAVMRYRAEGEKAASICEHRAADDDDVYAARLAYRTAEHLMTADREALKVLHAELDKARTDAADQRAANAWEARTGI